MSIRIALAGNPNSGKTTLFNTLTGSNQFVGNWPGVTVEKKEGKLKKNDDVIITDLPGIYSLSPYTLEEVVARDYLIGTRPDAILNIVDGTNLERNLYLTTQLTELGIPVVIAINMMDVVRKNGDEINTEELSRQLGCKIVEISALKNEGITEAADEAMKAAKGGRTIPQHTFQGCVEHALAHIEEVTVHDLPEEQQRWYSIKLFERDEKVLEKLNLSEEVKNHIEKDIRAAEEELDDDSESIIMPGPFAQRLPLQLHQLGNSFHAVAHQRVQLIMAESPAFPGSLQFDKLPPLIHDEIHIHLGGAVFLIAQVQAGFIPDNAGADRRHLVYNRADQQFLFPDQAVHRACQRHHCAGNGCGPGAAVRLQHIAVQGNRPLSQRFQVHRLAERTPDQPLDFDAAAIFFNAVTLFPFRRGCRKHGILRRNPSLPFIPQERRHRFLHAGRTDHPGIPRGNQAAAVCRPNKIRFNCDRPLLVRPSSICAHLLFPPVRKKGFSPRNIEE